MMGVFRHSFLWVFDSDDCGGVDRVISAAQDTGYGLCVKFHDGDPSDDAKYAFQEKFAQIAEKCLPLGIPLLAWGYCYGDTYGNLLKEANAAVQVLSSYPVGYVIDAEAEWEVAEGRSWAVQFGDRILSKVPDAKSRLAYAPQWNLRYGHPLYPADMFSIYCSAVMPQDYFDLAGRTTLTLRREMVQVMADDYRPLGLPVYPIGQFSAGLSGVKDFLDLLKAGAVTAAGFPAWSFWLLDRFQDSEGFRYLAELAKITKPDELAAIREEVAGLKGDVGRLWQTLARIKEAIT